MKKFFGVFTALLFLAAFSAVQSAEISAPAKYKSMLNKKWTVTKCTVKDKDSTKDYYGKSAGEPTTYLFKTDGTIETNLKDEESHTWSFDKDVLIISYVIVDGKVPVKLKYSIEKITAKNLQIDVKPMKLSITMEAK